LLPRTWARSVSIFFPVRRRLPLSVFSSEEGVCFFFFLLPFSRCGFFFFFFFFVFLFSFFCFFFFFFFFFFFRCEMLLTFFPPSLCAPRILAYLLRSLFLLIFLLCYALALGFFFFPPLLIGCATLPYWSAKLLFSVAFSFSFFCFLVRHRFFLDAKSLNSSLFLFSFVFALRRRLSLRQHQPISVWCLNPFPPRLSSHSLELTCTLSFRQLTPVRIPTPRFAPIEFFFFFSRVEIMPTSCPSFSHSLWCSAHAVLFLPHVVSYLNKMETPSVRLPFRFTFRPLFLQRREPFFSERDFFLMFTLRATRVVVLLISCSCPGGPPPAFFRVPNCHRACNKSCSFSTKFPALSAIAWNLSLSKLLPCLTTGPFF